jgi:4-hydroxysphinganine ceramide fatty acyl 2-hydroxylase
MSNSKLRDVEIESANILVIEVTVVSKYVREFCSDRRPQFLALMGLIYFIYALSTGWNLWTWTALIGGMVFFFVSEYFTHRFLLHGIGKLIMPKGYKAHVDHHEYPEQIANMLTPNRYNIPYHIALWLIHSLIFQSIHLAAAYLGGFIIFQIYYEWAHFVSHRPIVPRTTWGKSIKKHHLLHHFKTSQAYYGVTNSALDHLLGTDQAAGGKRAESEGATL